MRFFKRRSSKRTSSSPDKFVVSPALPEDSLSDSRFASGMDSGLFSKAEAQADSKLEFESFVGSDAQQDDYASYAAYESESQDFSRLSNEFSQSLPRGSRAPYTFMQPEPSASTNAQLQDQMARAPRARTPFTYIEPQSAQSTTQVAPLAASQYASQYAEEPDADYEDDYASDKTDYTASESVDAREYAASQNPQSQLFGAMADEKTASIKLEQMFCANEQDDTAELASKVGFGSARDDAFTFIPLGSQPVATVSEDQVASDAANTATDAAINVAANAATELQARAEGYDKQDVLDEVEPSTLSAEQAAEDGVERPIDEHEAAAQLIANMMLGRNPLANLTADTNQELEQSADLNFATSKLESAADDLKQDGLDLAAVVAEDDAVSEVAGLRAKVEGAADADPNLGETTESDAADDVGLELLEEPVEAEDDCLVNKRIKEPKHKIELVEDDEPPHTTFLDPESEKQAALAEQREDAIVQAFVGKVEQTPPQNRPRFTLLSTQVTLGDTPEKEVEPNLLSEEEKEANGSQADINEFVTGNITTLRTGTDDVALASGGGASRASESVEHDDESDDTLEQPEIPVEHVLEDVESLNESERNQYYTSTLPSSRGTVTLPKLLPTLMQDISRYFYVYSLAILLGMLCLLKVYQVQDTRNLTAQLNEVAIDNAELEKEWLNLLATRQNLSEHAKIRSYATRQLEMVSPKTENEQVISLHP